MKQHERALIEIQAWIDSRGEGFSINYAAHNPAVIDGIPHRWSCQAGRTDREHYTGFGVTMADAVTDCYRKWQTA